MLIYLDIFIKLDTNIKSTFTQKTTIVFAKQIT